VSLYVFEKFLASSSLDSIVPLDPVYLLAVPLLVLPPHAGLDPSLPHPCVGRVPPPPASIQLHQQHQHPAIGRPGDAGESEGVRGRDGGENLGESHG